MTGLANTVFDQAGFKISSFTHDHWGSLDRYVNRYLFWTPGILNFKTFCSVSQDDTLMLLLVPTRTIQVQCTGFLVWHTCTEFLFGIQIVGWDNTGWFHVHYTIVVQEDELTW